MSANWFIRWGLTGGDTEEDLDGLSGNTLKDSDIAMVFVSGVPEKVYMYLLDGDSGIAESSPDVITPDTNPLDKRWIAYKGDANWYLKNSIAEKMVILFDDGTVSEQLYHEKSAGVL